MIAEHPNSPCSYSYLPNCPQRVGGPKLFLFWDKLPSFLWELIKLYIEEAITKCNRFDLLAVNSQSINYYMHFKVFLSLQGFWFGGFCFVFWFFFFLFRNYLEGTEPLNFWFKISPYAGWLFYWKTTLLCRAPGELEGCLFSVLKVGVWLKRSFLFCMLVAYSDTEITALVIFFL